MPISNRVVSLRQPPTAAKLEEASSYPNLAFTLTPAAENWQETTHVHGLRINSSNPVIAYIATHYGLLQRNASVSMVKI